MGCRSAPVTIRAGLLLDGRGGQVRDAVITVRNGRIEAVGPWQGVEVTHDLSGRTVLPGLIDAHVHITSYITPWGRASTGRETEAERAAGTAANARATLHAGFTTVVSLATRFDKELRARINSGSIPGPRILTALIPFRDTALSLLELRREVRRLKAGGADFIKIFASHSLLKGAAPVFRLEQLAALCDAARQVGLRSAVHAMSDASIRQAADAGCDTVEHGSFATRDGLDVLVRRGLFYDPQCRLVLRTYLENRARYAGIGGMDSSTFATMQQMLPTLPAVIRNALATPGLKLVFGTDALAGAHGRNADDLVCRVREAGQSPMDALVTATSRNAEALGLGDELGRIAPGYRADLIALDGDPLQEIEAVQRVTFVMKGGKVFLSR